MDHGKVEATGKGHENATKCYTNSMSLLNVFFVVLGD
jgi:hypothetical protein